MVNNEMVLISIAVLAGIFALAFWGSMAVHCFKNRELSTRERPWWLVAVVFGKLGGAAAYYLLRYRRRSSIAAPG